VLQPDPEPLFTPEVLAAGRAKVRQRTRDRVAEQRAVVARDYSVEWSALVAARPMVAQRVAAIALQMHAAKPAGHLYINAVWTRYGEEHGEAIDNNLRAPAARWLMEEHPALAGRFRTRATPGDPTRTR
jgi:hypothetical protein